MANETECPCRRECERHGKCGECRAQHEGKRYLPACERKKRKKKAPASA